MSVYVDAPRRRVPGNPRLRFEGQRFNQRWSNLWADTEEELHKAAEAVGLQKDGPHFYPDKEFPNYSVGPKQRAMLVAAGAKDGLKLEAILLQIRLKRKHAEEKAREAKAAEEYYAKAKADREANPRIIPVEGPRHINRSADVVTNQMQTALPEEPE